MPFLSLFVLLSFVYLLRSIKNNLFLLAPTSISFFFKSAIFGNPESERKTFLTHLPPAFGLATRRRSHSHV